MKLMLKDVWSWISEWVKKKLRSPFSNYITRMTLFIGSAVVASPLIEHLIFNAILKSWLGIDLGIEVPDLNAYIFGSTLILMAIVHNLLFLRVSYNHQVNIASAKVSVYRELWERLDIVLDNVARLNNLYFTHYSEEEDKLALTAEESVISCTDFLRKNRPFFFSDDFYRKVCNINNEAWQEITAFRCCLKYKKKEEALIGKDADIIEQLEFSENEYNFNLAQKEAQKIIDELMKEYDAICSEIRNYINSF